jgi:hypothetical protein
VPRALAVGVAAQQRAEFAQFVGLELAVLVGVVGCGGGLSSSSAIRRGSASPDFAFSRGALRSTTRDRLCLCAISPTYRRFAIASSAHGRSLSAGVGHDLGTLPPAALVGAGKT